MSDSTDRTLPSGERPDPGEPEAYCSACGKSYPPDTKTCPDDRTVLVRIGGTVDPLLGRVFEERYEIRSKLGEGGMGAVYVGWQRSVDREVAIKVIDPKLSRNRDVVKRFLREARLSSRLSQPSIVNVYDFGQTEDGILYIVMELLRGHTLHTELQSRRVFPLERAMRIAVQLCDALEGAHKLGIVHRDLKPSNVVLLADPPGRDFVKVLDFGLAKSLVHETMSKVTQSDAMMGTPLYMSPEQIEGQPSDQRTDLYSLGCILHEMVSGTSPFAAKTVDRVLSNHIYEMAAPLPPDLPAPLAELILRLIAKHPDERPGSAAEVRASLQAIAQPPTSVTTTPAKTPSRRAWLIVASVAVGAIVGGLAYQLRPSSKSPAVSPPPVASDAPEVRTATPADAALASDAPVIDASAPVDARVVHVDAGHRTHTQVAPTTVDAGSDLEFYRIDAAR